MKQIEVVAAIIHDDEGRIFATQRGYGDYKDGWEFPGGKMEPGESPEDALKREIWEELETKIVVERLVQTVEYDYPDISVRLTLFRATVKEGEPTSMEGNAIQWITPEEIPDYLFCPADKPIVERLQKEAKQ